MKETLEQQKKDSDMIFNAISSGDFYDYKMAERAVVSFYVMDMSFSRSGISHALKRLEDHYKKSEANKSGSNHLNSTLSMS